MFCARRSVLRFVALSAIIFGALATTTADAQVALRIGCTNPAGSVVTDPIDRFVDLLAQKTNNQVTAKNFYQAFGVEQRLAQTVMDGTVDIGTMTTASATTFTSAFFPYELPFLFRAYDDMLNSLESPVAKRLIAQFEKDTGLKVLAIFGFGLAATSRHGPSNSRPRPTSPA